MERITILTLRSSNPFLHSSSSNLCETHLALTSPLNPIGGGGRVCAKPRTSSCRFVVLSTHSNPKILKSNRRSPYGQALSPYDTDEEDDEDDVGGSSDDDWLLNVSFFYSLL